MKHSSKLHAAPAANMMYHCILQQSAGDSLHLKSVELYARVRTDKEVKRAASGQARQQITHRRADCETSFADRGMPPKARMCKSAVQEISLRNWFEHSTLFRQQLIVVHSLACAVTFPSVKPSQSTSAAPLRSFCDPYDTKT